VVSRSGSLSYEVAHQLTWAGIGQSTALGIGGDPVKGLRADEALALLHQDPETRAVVFVGEIGGNDEYEVAAYAARGDAKPVTALIVGRTAPRGKKMGHAAALIGSHADTHEAKLGALAGAGADAIQSLRELLPSVRRNLATSSVAPLAQA
jgi:succinyl-CoA synthetase alpha subunit